MSFLKRNWTKRLAGWLRGRLLLLLVLAGLVWITTHLLTTADYRVTRVDVVGNKLIPMEDVVQATKVRDRPVLLVNRREVELSLSKLKALKKARVETELPNRVVIEIVERPPAFVWKVRDTLYLVSDDGIVLGTTPVANQTVALVDVDAEPVGVGAQVDADALQTARWLLTILPKELALTPSYFEYSHAEGVVLPTDFAGRIAFGWSGDRETKVATLKSVALMIRQEGLKVKYLDLRHKDRPYFR